MAEGIVSYVRAANRDLRSVVAALQSARDLCTVYEVGFSVGAQECECTICNQKLDVKDETWKGARVINLC